MSAAPSQDELRSLESCVQAALETSGDDGLEVLGYGEISTVLRLEGSGNGYACKRLPPFETKDAFAAYRETFEAYLRELDARGVRVVPSTLRVVERADGRLSVFCVQPVLPSSALLPRCRGDAQCWRRTRRARHCGTRG